MAKIKRKSEEETIERLPYSEVRHKCECLCLKAIPGLPNRIGYITRYLDSQNKPRCTYCNCLALDFYHERTV